MNLRNILGIAVFVAILGYAGWSLRGVYNDPTFWPPDDYVEYWAAGRLNLHGQNPYSQDLLLPLERSAGRDTDEAIMMWNPPWTLAIVMPVGTLPARMGQFFWLFVNLAAVVVSGLLIWNTYSIRTDQRWLGLALAMTFVPTLFLLQSGQISGLVLLGLALVTICCQRQWFFMAGVVSFLIAVKPHLAYLLWCAVLFDAIYHRRWRFMLGGITGGLVATGVAMAFNPDVWTHYFAAYRDYPPAQWVSLTIGSILRLAFGANHFWLQFVAPLAGLVWFAWYWNTHKKTWNWVNQIPVIALVSFVTTPYGAWHFDLVILLLPIWHRTATLECQLQRTLGVIAMIIINLTCLSINALGLYSIWFVWVAPVVFALYFVLPKMRPTREIQAVPGVAS